MSLGEPDWAFAEKICNHRCGQVHSIWARFTEGRVSSLDRRAAGPPPPLPNGVALDALAAMWLNKRPTLQPWQERRTSSRPAHPTSPLRAQFLIFRVVAALRRVSERTHQAASGAGRFENRSNIALAQVDGSMNPGDGKCALPALA
jgi:hypothetical protein